MWADYPLLVLVGVPWAGALATVLVPAAYLRTVRGTALVFSLATFSGALWLWPLFGAPGSAAMPLIEYYPWIAPLGITVHLGLDGMSLLLVCLTGFMACLVLAAQGPGTKGYYILPLVLHGALNGAFMALDIYWYICCVTVAGGALFFLVGIWGGEQGWAAARRFFLITACGQLCLAAAALYIGMTVHASGADLGFSLESWDGVVIPSAAHPWVVLLVVLGFVAMIPMLPLHAWLPEICAFAPARIAALMVGLWPVLGFWGLVRFGLPFLPDAAMPWHQLLAVWAMIGMLYAGLIGLVHGDLSRRLACNGMAVANIAVLGLCTADPGLGIQGGILLMVGSVLALGALMLMAGAIRHRLAIDRIERLGGLAITMPLLAGGWLCASLMLTGIPGSPGFIGLWSLLISGGAGLSVYGVGTVACLVLVSASLARTFYQVMLGQEGAHRGQPVDLSGHEFALVLVLFLVSLGVGLAPRPVLERLEPAAVHAADKSRFWFGLEEGVGQSAEAEEKGPE